MQTEKPSTESEKKHIGIPTKMEDSHYCMECDILLCPENNVKEKFAVTAYSFFFSGKETDGFMCKRCFEANYD